MSNRVLPPGSLILVTGINGYIGSHIADQLLSRGYRVRGTARDAARVAPVLKVLRERNPQAHLEEHIVPNMTVEKAFHEAVEGCSGVIHVASDISLGSDPTVVVPITVNGLLNALKASASVSTVKRFVYTSSSIAAVRPLPDTKFHVDSDSWNEDDLKVAWAPPPYEQSRSFAVYAAGKTESERAAWTFVKEQKPPFIFNAVLPNFNVGPILHSSQSASTAGWVNNLYQNTERVPEWLKNFPPQYHIDVVDCAKIHVAALLEGDVRNERLFAFAHPFSYEDTIRILRDIDPSFKNYPEPPKDGPRDLSTVANERAEELLKRYDQPRGFKGYEESIKDQFAYAAAR